MRRDKTSICLGTNPKVVHERVLFQGSIKPLPKIGAPVFDSKGTRIGKVHDIIGPVGRPWVVVKRLKADLKINSVTTFYASKRSTRRRNTRQNRKRSPKGT